MSTVVSDNQLISYFRKVEKIVKETEIYSKRAELLKHDPSLSSSSSSSILDEEDELLFPIEIGQEMHIKALKVYLDTKAYIESLDKSIGKYVEKIGKNEKAANVIKNHHSNMNMGASTSSSSDDDSGEVQSERETSGRRSMKRKSKEPSSSSTSSASSNNNNNGNSSNSASSNNSSSNSFAPSNSSISQKTKRLKPPAEQKEESAPPPQPSIKPETPLKEKESSSTSTATAPGGASGHISNGTLVAARERSGNNVNWILAKVNGFNNKNQKYEVIDEDEDEPKRFFVGLKDILQLPPSPVTTTFTTNSKVLAMFPDTTAFYPAIVVSVTRVKNRPTHYTLHFDDDQGDNGQTPSRRVSAQYVVSFSK